MNKTDWKKKIIKACKDVGTYRPYFGDAIDILAGIMAARDAAEEKYEASGAQPVVKHTNQGGNTNIVKNPVLVLVMELQAQALAYWRDLGLTPAGLKRIDEKAVKAQKKNTMAEAFKNIGI